MDAATILARMRDGTAPSSEEMAWFVAGLASGAVTDAQAGAFAMAVCLQGLGDAGRNALTLAMRDTGHCLDWDLPGPVVDKHSTGGIGDCVSLVLAPVLAAAGAHVPMISGRGLGHTGGTLDKLSAIPGLTVDQPEDGFRRIVAQVGCAIVSASAELAPADQRLYGIRDVTGTVASVDLITASILSKKLAAGIGALVLDVKAGSGAVMGTEAEARALAEALVATATGAGCRTAALITDMDQPLAPAAGNAVEVAEVLAALTTAGDSRLSTLSAELAGAALALVGIDEDAAAGAVRARALLSSGAAAERFAAMVHAQGGPGDILDRWDRHLPRAPEIVDVAAPRAGHVAAIDGRALGMAVVALGGGRRREGDRIDPAVGLSGIARLGEAVTRGAPIATIHAASPAAAATAAMAVRAAFRIDDAPLAPPPLIRQRIGP